MDQEWKQAHLAEMARLTSRVQDASMEAEGQAEKEEVTKMMERLDMLRSMVENPQETVDKVKELLHRG